ncbi:DNA-processing protein DprA [Clostridium sp.]|uniref:DNA-processing protein DprA n=1 Tax=Clostridium sp. TaxID=1506 RepID=UPI002FC9692B
MLTNDDKAILLLCSYVGIKDESIKPLTLKKWNELATTIFNSNIKRPGNLFNMSEEEISKELSLTKRDIDNIMNLLSRSLELGVDLERLYSKGINVVTRASNMYPNKLKKILKDLAPPVLFYCGNLSLLNIDGIGIVGSRKVKEEHIEFTKHLVQKAVSENLIIYSGGARGIDDTSEKEAFLSGGSYVSFLSDSLESKIKKKEVRDKIASGRVLLMSSSKPNAGFQVGLAMNRNKYIYASSRATFVITSEYNKGGTWTGATENMKNNWTKTFIKQDIKSKGVQELIKIGAIPIVNIKDITLIDLINNNVIKNTNEQNSFEQIDLESLMVPTHTDGWKKVDRYTNDDIFSLDNNQLETSGVEKDKKEDINYDLYYHVIEIIVIVLKEERNIEQLSEILNVSKSQISIWIKKGIEEGKIKKLSKPVRYIAIK